ncbi:hypothetical protein [uncultured Lactobacillus sp.]|uniref:spr1630 family ClpXP-sensitive toxin n=1 Tax=uncultured Lactobacillus sp. TaxID=153152 RepID=UPI002621D4E7|nr:hypothetical protein [uncultured Lactobacillus sp.]
MDNLKLTEDVNQFIVNGIVNGYKEYLAMRKRENARLVISTGLSWAKGNYIDTALNNIAENADVKFEMAGGWKFLSYSLKNDEFENPDLLIVRNARTANQQFHGNIDDIADYLREDAAINNHLFSKNEIVTKNSNRSVQLELPLIDGEEKSKSKVEKYNRFYIAIYELDKNQNIKSIRLELPNQKSAEFLEVEDLTKYIQNTATITEDELEPVRNDNIPAAQYDNHKFNITEIAQQQQENNDRN